MTLLPPATLWTVGHSTHPIDEFLDILHAQQIQRIADVRRFPGSRKYPHFNPDAKKHGMQNPEGPHAGDMNNFTVAADGTAKATVTDPNVTMGSGANSIFTNGGTALVIHAAADDMKTDPSGNSGDRIACGAITKM